MVVTMSNYLDRNGLVGNAARVRDEPRVLAELWSTHLRCRDCRPVTYASEDRPHPVAGCFGLQSDAPNGYKATVTLLGPATVAPRPFTLGVWHDFYMHIIWRSRSSGVLTIWHRQESGFWEKLYDNTGAQDALITAPPHPTLMYNDANGAPGEGSRPGVSLQAGFYRGQQNVVNDYWFDGFRRRQDETSIVAGFPADNAASLPFGGLLRGRSEL